MAYGRSPQLNSNQAVNSLLNQAPQANLDQITPFLKWVDDAILHPHTTKTETLMGFIGFSIGVMSTLATYPLGSGFGRVLAQAIKADPLSPVFEIFFGSSALVSTGTLLGMPNKNQFVTITQYLEGRPQFPLKQDRKRWRNTALAAINVFVTFAGIPFYYLIRENIYKNVIPWSAIIGSYFACLGAASQISTSLFNMYAKETPEVTAARMSLKKKLAEAITAVREMTDEEIYQFHRKLTQALKQNHPQLSTFKKMNELLSLKPQPPEDAVAIVIPDNLVSAEVSNRWDYKLITLDIISSAMGLLATSTLIVLAQNTATEWADVLGGDDDLKAFIAGSISMLGIASNCVFNMIYTTNKCNRIYSAIKEHDYKPSVLSTVAQSLAVCSATPNAYIAIKSANTAFGYILIAPSFLSPALAQSLGFEALLSEVSERYRTTFKKEHIATKRYHILNVLVHIQEALSALDHNQLLGLEQALKNGTALIPPAVVKQSMFASRELNSPEVDLRSEIQKTLR